MRECKAVKLLAVQPVEVVVIGGISISLVLSLIVTPTVHSYMDASSYTYTES